MRSNTNHGLPVIKTTIPGPKSQQLLSKLRELEAPNLTNTDNEITIVWERTTGANIIDVDGNQYIDMAAGLNVANIGHTHPAVQAAVSKQIEEMLQGMGDFHANIRKIEFMEFIQKIIPIPNAKMIVSVNGSDAVDSALKTANLATGKSGYIAFYGAYHGMGAKSIEVTARHHFRRPFKNETKKSTAFAPYPYCYRCPYGEQVDTCKLTCLKTVQDMIENTASGVEDVAAVIIEPIQGRGGVVVAPQKFLQGLREICDRNNVLLIFDEILTGFGRTGKMFSFLHSGVIPDIMTIGKGLSSGYPISVCAAKQEVMDKAWGQYNGEPIHTSTFQGNPLGSVIAMASIKELLNSNLVEKSHYDGLYLQKELRNRIGAHPNVGDIRGNGLMVGIELVKDRDTKEAAPELCWEIIRRAMKKGVLLLNGGHQVNVLCLTPPLCITNEQLNFVINILETILNELKVELYQEN